MKKIPTMFKKNPENLGRVIDEINCEWATTAIATRKWDGMATAVIDNVLYKRYDVKKGKAVPEGAIPCQEPDEITGHWPHWVKVDRFDPADKWLYATLADYSSLDDGTYEFVGPKVNGNKEQLTKHEFKKHGADVLTIPDRSFEGIKKYLTENDIEGIVFYDINGDMCKIRKTDFGIKR